VEETLGAMNKSGRENFDGDKAQWLQSKWENDLFKTFRNVYGQTSYIFHIRCDRISCSQKGIQAKEAKTLTSKDQIGYITHLMSSVGEHVLI
jgi:hypothetical protein